MADYPALKLFINDRWCEGEGRRTEPVLNPSTEAVLGGIAARHARRYRRGAGVAVKGYQVWRKTSPAQERARILQARRRR